MEVNLDHITDVKKKLEIKASAEELKKIKKQTLERLRPEVSAPGFRKGKVPLNVVEKNIDENYLKSQFLDDAMSSLFSQAVIDNDLRPISRPEVEIQKFVAFDTCEFTVSIEVIPPVKLGKYKGLSVKPEEIEVTDKDVDDVIENLRKRHAQKEEVDRTAKSNDEVVIDVKGTDDKGNEVAGAKGTDYPLLLGSDTFIPGFEKNLEGTKAGDSKTFDLTFPKDYAHKPLANKKITFDVTVKKVHEVKLPKVDDKLAALVGPFKKVDELKKDIKVQLQHERNREADNMYKDKLVRAVVEKSSVEIPDSLLSEQMDMLENDLRQNLVYRGITIAEYLEQRGQTEEEYRDQELKPQAERRVATGLVLSEIAKKEELTVSEEEVEIRVKLMRSQYQDPSMQAQLDTPEALRDISSRLLTEKTVDRLVQLNKKD